MFKIKVGGVKNPLGAWPDAAPCASCHGRALIFFFLSPSFSFQPRTLRRVKCAAPASKPAKAYPAMPVLTYGNSA